jgi:hypothetical protein
LPNEQSLGTQCTTVLFKLLEIKIDFAIIHSSAPAVIKIRHEILVIFSPRTITLCRSCDVSDEVAHQESKMFNSRPREYVACFNSDQEMCEEHGRKPGAREI